MAARPARIPGRRHPPAQLPGLNDDPLNAARGLAAALLMGLMLWLAMGAGLYLCCLE